ncbi:hypothetical protein JQ604_26460 [Bradyrhizobium jicamae]|uniref:hypothetical protein n=1 Tax=Bradyrhizobium jicamae TaxID=280332 RepID=UPI001BA48686|nr:hypothetical protein [Bradyrhizobium jicamae]MBR0755732.1 hypothetical protein [Bradyrhizobium jicamae]
MGAMLGGEFVWKDEDGERIDLGETLVAQARWNKLAARSAAVGAILAAAAMIIQSQKIATLWPKCIMLGAQWGVPRHGRPSGYYTEYADQAAKLCRLGATDAEFLRQG